MHTRTVLTAVASLSTVVSSNASAGEINQENFIKLASIAPLVEVAGDILVSVKTGNGNDRIEDECISKGYQLGLTCPPSEDPTLCTTERCQDAGVGYNFVKCTCYCNATNTCTEMGYTQTSCPLGSVVESECLVNKKYVKCKCDPCAGYDKTSCSSGYVSAGTCLSCGVTKHKCTVNPCTGYDKTSCPSGYVSAGTCLSGTTTKYKCVVNPCTGYDYTSCASGYVSAGTCLSGSTTKYKCVANPCTGYDYTSCASGYVSAGTCLSGTTTKYKCVANPCTGYDYTTCASGYVSTGTCLSGTITKHKCKITPEKQCTDAGYALNKTCTSAHPTHQNRVTCPYSSSYFKCVTQSSAEMCTTDGYVLNKTCDSSHSIHQKRSACSHNSSYYKCVAMTTQEMCNNDGYNKTSCQAGYVLKNKCSHGNYYLVCEITPAQKCKYNGYTVTSCGEYFDVVDCPYLSTYKRCDATCESNLVAQGYKVNQNYTNAIITKSMTIAGSTAPTVKSVESYRSVAKCDAVSRPKPTLTLDGVGDMKNKYYDGLNLKSVNSGYIYVGGSTVRNGNIDFSGNTIVTSDGTFKHYSSSTTSKVTFKSQYVRAAYQTYSCTFENAILNITGRFAAGNGGGSVYFKNVDFTANELFAKTASTATMEFSNGSIAKVTRTELGHNNYVRGSRLRLKGASKWYMSYGPVIMSDDAHFCVDDDDGSYIYFANGYKKGGRGRAGYDGCRIHDNKTRTLTYTDWDPSDYTSWEIRSYCAEN